MDISNFTLVGGSVGGEKSGAACLMSARALLDGRPFGDEHPSQVLRRIGIRLNDGNWWSSDVERTTTLMPLALDERLCASKCDASREAEIARAKLCANWALSEAAPMALDAAAAALRDRWPDRAALLSSHADKLRREPTRDNALAARKDAASYAAAADADASYADAVASSYADAADAAYAAAVASSYADAADAAYAAAAASSYADAAYADAAYAAAAAASYAAASASKRIEARKQVRDSLIALFGRLLEVDTRGGVR
jgi:hypothetical protein